jgi:hypothetical protein
MSAAIGFSATTGVHGPSSRGSRDPRPVDHTHVTGAGDGPGGPSGLGTPGTASPSVQNRLRSVSVMSSSDVGYCSTAPLECLRMSIVSNTCQLTAADCTRVCSTLAARSRTRPPAAAARPRAVRDTCLAAPGMTSPKAKTSLTRPSTGSPRRRPIPHPVGGRAPSAASHAASRQGDYRLRFRLMGGVCVREALAAEMDEPERSRGAALRPAGRSIPDQAVARVRAGW